MSSAVERAAWVEDAANFPVGFAQVREDALVDLAIVRRFERPPRVLMVASGGCTAALLAGSGEVASLHLVDPNAAQIALSRLKLLMAAELAPLERLAPLGHSAMAPAVRRRWLEHALNRLDLPADALGPPELVAEAGPDYAGRYERVFFALREALRPRHREIESLLKETDPGQQREHAAPETPLGQALDAALAEVMALPSLVRLFGEEATQNPVMPFHRHFAERLQVTLATLPAATNPYLWQMLLARFPVGIRSPWLDAARAAETCPVTWECTFMLPVLERSRAEFDFVHLSNILDWLSPARAAQVLEQAWKALRPAGCVLVRQLNSSLDIRALAPAFDWQIRAASQLHRSDRSFFYRALHWGVRW